MAVHSAAAAVIFKKTKTHMEVTSKWSKAAGLHGPHTQIQSSGGECEAV